ncbi:hypothetical protein, partial [Bacteroides uniformis]|uniref:hypothetical protein n=1 Tax=Bacteroides uniformis TaxID=820 RepID=UPI0039B69057
KGALLNVLRGQNRLVLGGSLHWIFQPSMSNGIPQLWQYLVSMSVSIAVSIIESKVTQSVTKSVTLNSHF